MSLRNRARSLQQKLGLSYQQALAKLRALGRGPAILSRQTGWPLEVCDRFLVDGHAPIEVIELVRPPTRRQLIAEVCERLRVTANARAVVVAARGRVVAMAGEVDRWRWPVALARVSPATLPKGTARRWAELPDVWELEGGVVLHRTGFKRGMLVVKFHRDETSLGLVRLRAARAAEDLERLLADDPDLPPPGGRGGPGGLPAEVRVVEETRQAPPCPRPKPIGRKR